MNWQKIPFTGGPAFPTPMEIAGSGMTLRDYFAAQAMAAAIINSDHASVTIEEIGGWIGSYAYTVADALLEARDK